MHYMDPQFTSLNNSIDNPRCAQHLHHSSLTPDQVQQKETHLEKQDNSDINFRHRRVPGLYNPRCCHVHLPWVRLYGGQLPGAWDS